MIRLLSIKVWLSKLTGNGDHVVVDLFIGQIRVFVDKLGHRYRYMKLVWIDFRLAFRLLHVRYLTNT